MFESNSDWYEQAQVVARFIHKYRAGMDGWTLRDWSGERPLGVDRTHIEHPGRYTRESPVLGRCVPTRRLKGPDDHPPTCSRRGLSPGSSESDADH